MEPAPYFVYSLQPINNTKILTMGIPNPQGGWRGCRHRLVGMDAADRCVGQTRRQRQGPGARPQGPYTIACA
ncbi:hypothetical protein CMUS01_06996 [Colletotrichum musicola]|uniref:Uncharacterized protein n=1 Tax=Colletotrichum musicola TaxID=2175873 RepID=A0A8H6KK58_9PEZI|nr:hypothetical protein CMUS01_06996 [Colletotrichum musicola]